MEWSPFLLAFVAGCGAGAVLVLGLLRGCGLVRRLDREKAELQLPFLGKFETRWEYQPDGLYLFEAQEVLEKIQRFNRLVDFGWLAEYARQYRISYIGFKGRRGGQFWNPGCLACSSLDWSPRGGYRVYLNPDLDVEETAARLSRELGLEIQPGEVQPFLFLHEVGHTRQAGNVCFISAAISSALSGGRRTHRRRKEIHRLRLQVEKYADDFAVRELLKWRVSRGDAGSRGPDAGKENSRTCEIFPLHPVPF